MVEATAFLNGLIAGIYSPRGRHNPSGASAKVDLALEAGQSEEADLFIIADRHGSVSG